MTVLNQVKATYKVLRSVQYGNGENVVFEANGKTYAICSEVNGFNIYRCFQEASGDWTFCPGFKFGKSMRTVNAFIKA